MLISDRLLNIEELEYFYSEYDKYCKVLWSGDFYVKYLSNEEFIKEVKTYDDWFFLQIEVGYLSDSDLYQMIISDFEFNYLGDMVKVYTDYGESIQLVKLSEPKKSFGQYDKNEIVKYLKSYLYEK